MDPFAAFSLACGIIQCIDFSTKVVKKCHELYRDGVSSNDQEIEDMARHLTDLGRDLDLPNQDDNDELMDLGSKCSTTAQELIAELKKMQVHGPHRKREAMKKTFKGMWRGDTIEVIQKRLEEFRKLLDSRILVALRRNYYLSALQQNKRFLDLDLKVQTIIVNLAQSPHNFDDLRSLIQVQNESIKGHITHELQQQRGDLALENYRQGILQSLWFPQIYSRQETVGENHQKTFQWIFEPEGLATSARRWHSFVRWLEQGDGIYWINGKAGSGKSTLMNYLHQDYRTLNLLRAWSNAKEVIILTFFFWNAGTTLEKTSEGLLRSLLYQILQKYPSLVRSTFDNQPAELTSGNAQQKSDAFAAWTERRLRTTFHKAILQAQVNCRICIFIDGLDETSSDSDELVAVIESILSANVKVCISSRPDLSYAEAFDSCAKLRLQDLTEPDIRIYVEDRLKSFLRNGSKDDVSQVLDSVVRKAQGVFLWVRVVVTAMTKGFRNEDCVKQLQIRIESLPSDMESLYANMLGKIEIAYREEAAQLLQMALANMTRSLLDVTLALCRGFDHMAEMSVKEVLRLSLRNQKRIPTICAGLLEVHLEDKDSKERGGKFSIYEGYVTLPCRYVSSSEIAEISYYERYAHIAFIHRTARDFLRQSKQARIFLEENSDSSLSLHFTYVRALLAKVTILGFPEIPVNVDADLQIQTALTNGFLINGWCDKFADKIASVFVYRIMRELVLEQLKSATAQVTLCGDVDRTLARLYQRDCLSPPFSHWFTRWCTMIPEACRISSRCFSPVSFYSARNEPALLTAGPVDCLGLAASWGLSRYVLEVLNLQQNVLVQSYIDYLLCCSTSAVYRDLYIHQYSQWVSAALSLTEELLSRGGNPNAYVEGFSTTIWGLFLNVVKHWAKNYRNKAFVTTAQAFLNAGADFHMKIRIRSHKSGDDLFSAQFRLGHERFVRLYLEVSAFTLVRMLSQHSLHWKIVEDIILAKGGCEYRKYIHVDCYSYGSSHVYKIPRSRHKNLVAALKESQDLYANQPSPGTLWSPVLEKICREHLANVGDTDSQTSLDDDVYSDVDVEEEYYEPHDFQTMEDAQDWTSVR